MPKIPSVLAAEAALSSAVEAVAPLSVEWSMLTNKAEKLNRRIQKALAPHEKELEEANEEQNRTLTRWVPRADGQSYTRYALRTKGPSRPCWDSRAWLRLMTHEGLSGRGGTQRRLWTLDIGVGAWEQIVLDPRDKKPSAPAPDSQEMLKAADAALVARKFILTDLDNE